ncbi:unnamed protein product [Parnassius mnemosyne]
MGVGKSRNIVLSKDLNIDLLNHHFSSSSNLNGATKLNTLNFLSSLPTPDHSSFVLNQFSACDVKKSILSITSNAIGSDCISRNMILPVLDIIIPILCHILNSSISCGVFPSTWKDAHIIPLPKKPNPTSFSEYRPISILPFLSKVLERLVYNQLSAFLRNNSLLNPLQSGFRPGHSTVTALVNITEDIRSAMEYGKLTILSLLDFSNAFNSIDFEILLGILGSLNISPTVIGWFQSYLSGRRQCIRIDDTFSSWCDTIAGVPQGGVLSPLLFSIFINSIATKITSSYHLYADDLQIYTHVSPSELHVAITTINSDLEQISDWAKTYGLKINPLKTQVIVIGSSNMIGKSNLSQAPQVVFDGNFIPLSEKVKDLGIYIDSNLSWGPQIQEVSRKLFAAARSLNRLRNFLPTATKIALAQSLLLPILDYADVSYLDLTEKQLDKLERLQNFCIRFIFGLRKYDHVSCFRNKLKWLPIRLRRNAHILSLLYNVLFNPSYPSYLKDRFEFLHYSHSKVLRSSENFTLKMPAHNTKFLDRSFTIQAVRLWNALPLSVRRAQSLSVFQKLVHNHYLNL